MKTTRKCKSCGGEGRVPNTEFEYCMKLAQEDLDRYGLKAGDCEHCEKSIKTDCNEGEFVQCQTCAGKGRQEVEFDIQNESEILEIILMHGELLTCFNCGEQLTEMEHIRDNQMIAALCIDPGRINYPREPDEPAGIYLECRECFEKRTQLVTCSGKCTSNNDICEHHGPHIRKPECNENYCGFCSYATGETVVVRCEAYKQGKKTDLKNWVKPKII